MKLTIQCVRNQGARIGRLTEVGRHGNKTLDTPMCMLYTRGGSSPHLTGDMLKKVQGVPNMVQMHLNQLAEYQETIAGYKEGMAKFSALGDKLVYTSIHDPAVEVKSGYNDKFGVGVWGKGGKTRLDVDGFMKVQEAVLPDWFQCLSDADTNKDSTKKRCRKAVDRTLNFLEEIVDRHSKSERVKDSCIFGTIVGGYDLRERERCTKETVSRNVDGYVIDGFHNLGPNSENFNTQDIKDLMKSITTLLPEDKPRIMSGVWRPDAVLHAMEFGIDIFDSSYPYMVTERGCALVFNYRYTSDPEAEDAVTSYGGFTIDINEKQYVDDFSPLLEGCSCYACQNFTRAYINHLLNTSELLASILLVMHNFHHYFQFFSEIRQALADDKLNQLKQIIVKQAQNSIKQS